MGAEVACEQGINTSVAFVVVISALTGHNGSSRQLRHTYNINSLQNGSTLTREDKMRTGIGNSDLFVCSCYDIC